MSAEPYYVIECVACAPLEMPFPTPGAREALDFEAPLRSAPCDCGECDGRGNVFDDAGEFIERHDPRPPTTTDQEQPA